MMKDKAPAAISGDIARDFDYAEPAKLSPTWQLIRDISETIVLTIVMFLVIHLAVQDFQVDGTSMVPTLQNGQFVLVDKLTYDFSAPQRGDIIVFMPPTASKDPYIKRVIGLPGDRIDITTDGVVSVNGVALTEPYVNNLENPYGEVRLTVGPHQYFVLGDNRGGSSDSREWGTVAQNQIIGKATLVYWPLMAFHMLPDAHSTFAQVPSASLPAPGPTGNTSPPALPLPLNVILLPLAALPLAASRLRRSA